MEGEQVDTSIQSGQEVVEAKDANQSGARSGPAETEAARNASDTRPQGGHPRDGATSPTVRQAPQQPTPLASRRVGTSAARTRPARVLADDAPSSVGETAAGWWRAFCRWLTEHVHAASWLPKALRQAWVIYLLAALVEVLVACVLPILLRVIPSFLFPESLLLFVITCIALAVGTGPALLATLTAGATIAVLLQPVFNALDIARFEDISGIVFLLVLGTMSAIVGGQALEGRLRAQRAAKEMDTFLSLVSHELRNPLTTAKMSTQLALRQSGGTKGQSSLQRAQEALNRMNLLVDDLLDASRARTGKLAISPKAMDLAEVAREAVAHQRINHPDREITLTGASAPMSIVADPRRVEQVIVNYLTNALKYSPSDAPVALTLSRHGPVACLAVRDRGPGLTAQQRRHVWERGYRVPGIEVQSGTGVGLGLGLYIARTIIERQGGTVGVESTRGQGSTFFFTLPLAPTAGSTKGVERLPTGTRGN